MGLGLLKKRKRRNKGAVRATRENRGKRRDQARGQERSDVANQTPHTISQRVVGRTGKKRGIRSEKIQVSIIHDSE